VVGLPCQIHGVHKAAELDRRIKERVVLTIGLFCHAAIEHEPMREIWEGIQKRAQGREIKRFISRVGKHPGTPYVEFEDGSDYFFVIGEDVYLSSKNKLSLNCN